ncbi:unnamed protein product [Ilex paraguariensis]|uniref:Uncharacterized protein n=1 Tax=Ilex paraguariensis TaxID=185542 RepID=A0ABC8SA84_9AQUA
MAEARREIVNALHLHRSTSSSTSCGTRWGPTMVANTCNIVVNKPPIASSQQYYPLLDSLSLPAVPPTWSTTAPSLLPTITPPPMESLEFEWPKNLSSSYAWWLGFLKTIDGKISTQVSKCPYGENIVVSDSRVLGQFPGGSTELGDQPPSLDANGPNPSPDDWLTVPTAEDQGESTHSTLSPSLIGAVIRRRQWKAVKVVCSSSPVQTTHKHNQQLLNLALELSSPDAQAFDFSFNTGGEKSTVKPQAPIKLEAVFLFLSDHRERAKHDYEQLKKIVNELRASEQNGEGDGVSCWFCASSTVSAWASGSLVFPLFPLDAIQGKAAASSGTTPLGEEELSFLGDPLSAPSQLGALFWHAPGDVSTVFACPQLPRLLLPASPGSS